MAIAAYVSNGGSGPAFAGMIRCWVALVRWRLLDRPFLDPLAWPLDSFGDEAGLVLTFRERARTPLPFEGVASICKRPQLRRGTERATRLKQTKTEDNQCSRQPNPPNPRRAPRIRIAC